MSLVGLNLRDLEYVVAVAEERHFGRAAARCHVSQSALSLQVRKVEDLLGIQIFERTNRRVVITPLGERVLERSRDLLRAGQELLDLRGLQGRPFAGALALGAIPTVGPYLMPLVLRPLVERYPELELSLCEEVTAVLIERVRRGDLDAAILSVPVGEPDLAAIEIAFEPFVLAARRGDPLLAGGAPAPDDLSPERIILLADGHCLRDQALAVCRSQLQAGGAPLQTTSLETLLQMIAVRGSYSLIPRLAALRLDDLQGMIVFRAFDAPAPGRTLGLIHRRTSAKAGDLQALADVLRTATRQALALTPGAPRGSDTALAGEEVCPAGARRRPRARTAAR